jgi:hypothetical protein
MARYSAFIGRLVELQYRAGDSRLSASATLLADSGRSIFLGQNHNQNGQRKIFRWEIPYHCIIRVDAAVNLESPAPSSAPHAAEPSAATSERLQANAAHAGVGSALLTIASRSNPG